jgi:hypothetical protein
MAFILTFVSLLAQAGYERTAWGMPYQEVKTLYPDGYFSKQENGNSNYMVIRPVAGFDTSYTAFTFDNRNKLTSVMIAFPEQGSHIDIKTGVFIEPTDSDGLEMFKLLKSRLELKYGKHTSKISDPMNISWMIRDPKTGEYTKDLVTLQGLPSKVNPGHRTVAVSYDKIPTIEQLNQGL